MKINEDIDKDKLFFTSDTHFHHKNIIEFCNRPFGDERIMDFALISNWNKVVPKDGIVFHAGDFAMTSRIDYIESIVSQLNGKIYLTLGNHDWQNRFDRQVVRDIFHQTDDMFYLTVRDEELDGGHVNFQICHYPFLYWRRGSYMLHGHVHSGPFSTANEVVPYHSMRYDIGVDAWNYTPVSYHQLKVILTKKSMI